MLSRLHLGVGPRLGGSGAEGVVINNSPSEDSSLPETTAADDCFCVCLCLSLSLCPLKVAFYKCSPAVKKLFFIWSLQLFLRD
jgi:hypothetical protein